jgi:N-acetylmuramic acid 6-phosphate etherase
MPKPPHADHLIILDTGPEILTGSTRMKAGTATKLALNTISTTLMVRTGRVFQNLMVDVRATNNKLTDRAARIIATLTGLARDESLALLDRAGGAVKTAVVMHSRAVPRGEPNRFFSGMGAGLMPCWGEARESCAGPILAGTGWGLPP